MDKQMNMSEPYSNPTSLLLVDDEKDLLDLMQLGLTARGYKVSVSTNGDNLLDLVARTAPDAILLDLQMDGVDGSTVCHLLRHNTSTSKIPIVILSGNADIETVAAQCGAHSFLHKPFSASRVDAELKRVLSTNSI